MLSDRNHVGYRTLLFAAFVASAVLGGNSGVSADTDSTMGFMTPSGVRVDYGVPLEATLEAQSVSQDAGAAQEASQSPQPVRALGVRTRAGITVHRGGVNQNKKVKIYRSGETDGAEAIVHRIGQWSGLASYESDLRIHRMAEPRGSYIRIHRMAEPRGSKIRIHRAGTWQLLQIR